MFESTWASMGYFLLYNEPDIRTLIRRLELHHLKVLRRKDSVVFNQYIYIYIYIYIRIVQKVLSPSQKEAPT